MAHEPDYYAVLGVPADADEVAIRLAYRRLARRYHPDVAGAAGLAHMQALNVAYQTLSDPQRRRAYDASHGIAAPAAASAPPPPSPARPTPTTPPPRRPRVGSLRASEGPLRTKIVLAGDDAQPVASLALAAEGRRAALGLLDGHVALWDVPAGRALASLRMGERATAGVLQDVRISPQATLVAGWGFQLGLRIWRASDGTTLWNTGMNAPSGLMDAALVDNPPFIRLALPDAPLALADDDPFRWANEGRRGTAVFARPLYPPVDPGWAVPLRCQEGSNGLFGAGNEGWKVQQRLLSSDGRSLLTICIRTSDATPTLHLHLWALEDRSRRGPRRIARAELPGTLRLPALATPDLGWVVLPIGAALLHLHELRG
ncbi:MAG TPA: J domain-containing protein, partial [Ktedonobacterales bacterium]|nr:J domain-containing protein [Ktedonobacterales bacterium]